MKKLLILLPVTLILLGAGCGSNFFVKKLTWNSWNSNGLSFSYPKTLTVSIDEFEPNTNKKIYVEQKTITDFIQYCVGAKIEIFESLDEYADEWTLSQNYKAILHQIRDGNINEDIKKYDSLSCGATNGNIKAVKIKVGDVNGIIYNKAMYQEKGSFSVFYAQILLVDSKDLVHSVVIPYDFGNVSDYIENNLEFAHHPLDNKNYPETPMWNQVVDYLTFDKSMSSQELRCFEENRNIIEEIIQTIKIK